MDSFAEFDNISLTPFFDAISTSNQQLSPLISSDSSSPIQPIEKHTKERVQKTNKAQIQKNVIDLERPKKRKADVLKQINSSRIESTKSLPLNARNKMLGALYIKNGEYLFRINFGDFFDYTEYEASTILGFDNVEKFIQLWQKTIENNPFGIYGSDWPHRRLLEIYTKLKLISENDVRTNLYPSVTNLDEKTQKLCQIDLMKAHLHQELKVYKNVVIYADVPISHLSLFTK